MSDPTRGIGCPDMRKVVREALAAGWTWDGMTGTTHARIRWRDGSTLSFGTTPSVASWKSLATDIKKTSGVEVWRKGNRKRSRKADQLTGFSLDTVRRERANRQADGKSEALLAEHGDLVGEAEWLATAGRRADKARFVTVLHRIQAIEAALSARHVPHERFDPNSLIHTNPEQEPIVDTPVVVPKPGPPPGAAPQSRRPSYLTGAKFPFGRGKGSLSSTVLVGTDGRFWCADCDHNADTFGGVFGHRKSCPGRPAKPTAASKTARPASTAAASDLDAAMALLDKVRANLPASDGMDWKARALAAEAELARMRKAIAGLAG